MIGNRVAIHLPHKDAKTFEYRGGALVEIAADTELERDGLAHLLWANRAYREKRYRVLR